MRPVPAIAALMIGLFLVFSGGIAQATMLISDDEALLPNDDSADVNTRAITRGPGIESVATGKVPVAHMPFSFIVHFVPHGGSKIDPSSVHVLYTKIPSIDLTERLRPFITVKGIELPDAVVPEGRHILRITVSDSDGRTSSSVIDIQAHKP
jgi:hypothetical protein